MREMAFRREGDNLLSRLCKQIVYSTQGTNTETQNTIVSETRLRIKQCFIDIYMSRIRIFV